MKRAISILTLALSVLSASAQKHVDRGFIHPGGMHTQADFDRIKQQLTEGHSKVTSAYEVLKSAEYAQSSAATYPTESIVRGGNGQNYINAARGAAIAYQNALRWKIEGNNSCAKHAVDVLMQWCRTTKYVTGNSDQCLARGLYGYQFAQAAELMRDYDGWAEEDFCQFQRWMLDVWYPGCINFLRSRNGTWENSGKWWQAPGHYWSNWGLCNAMAVISIGILCDDVFIYNQGMSFIKYDQCGTFTDPRKSVPILNDGLTEFWGNLIVTTSEWDKETGAYGKVGQMNESGRDTGHSAMALGLAVDIAHVGWNQGDDLFSYMDHRLAAGIEYVAAQCKSEDGLPWTNYHYASNGYYYTDLRSWLMTGPALGAQIRPYWGTVIGHYEGIKGVKMPFSEWAYKQMGIDGGGLGATSGGYDHLGYSVLTSTYGDDSSDFYLNPTPPTELQPEIDYDGKTYSRSELGGLINTFQTTALDKRALAKGTPLVLRPCLPEGETDTGKWLWNTGETTRSIRVTADKSYIYRVTYTNEQGISSQLCFPIAVLGDTHDVSITPVITASGTDHTTDVMAVKSGATVKLTINPNEGYGNWVWENGRTTSSITIVGVKETQQVRGSFQNQGGRQTWQTFTIYVNDYDADATRIADNGTYRLHHIPTGTYLTKRDGALCMQPLDTADSLAQIWYIDRSSALKRYNFMSLSDSTYVKQDGSFTTIKLNPYKIIFAQDTDRIILADKNDMYWHVNDQAELFVGHTSILYDFPFQLEAVTVKGNTDTSVESVQAPDSQPTSAAYTAGGVHVPQGAPNVGGRGVSIIRVKGQKARKIMN